MELKDKNISNMTADEFKEFITRIMNQFSSQSINYKMPNTILMPKKTCLIIALPTQIDELLKQGYTYSKIVLKIKPVIHLSIRRVKRYYKMFNMFNSLNNLLIKNV